MRQDSIPVGSIVTVHKPEAREYPVWATEMDKFDGVDMRVLSTRIEFGHSTARLAKLNERGSCGWVFNVGWLTLVDPDHTGDAMERLGSVCVR